MPTDLFTQRGDNDGKAPERSATSHVVRGEVLRVVFSSKDGQYVVLRLIDHKGSEHTIVGPMGELLEGQEIEASGRWENHKEHGRQLRVESFKAVLPSSEEGIRRYLASGLIKGIGPKYAQRIVERFGTDTLEVLDKYSERLREVAGVGVKRIAEIRKAWREHADQREVMVFLQGLGLSMAYCARVIAQYGAGAPEVIRRNPYQLATDVRGIGFLSADRIAQRLGVEKNAPQRLAAGVLHVLDQLAKQGHVCHPRQLLVAAAADVLDVGEKEAESGIDQAHMAGHLVFQNTTNADASVYVYLKRLYVAETELAEALLLLINVPRHPDDVPPKILGEEYGKLNDEQKAAVASAFSASVSIVTGGPGVGKTTALAQVVEVAARLRWRTLLAAPTGRAAKRMSECTSAEAKTIHRLLKWDPACGDFTHNADNPLHCDLLIVDEVSMLDVPLARSLFRAIQPGTRLVLVGDRDQLPSVGPGSVLHDLIRCGRISVTELTRVYRQSASSRIITNAHALNQGHMPDTAPVPKGRRADFYWIEQDDPEHAADIITRMVSDRIPKTFGFDPLRDIQVLVPMHRGSCGAEALNEALQNALSPRDKRPELSFGNRHFRIGDRVMQTVNNYDKGVFNGELGRVASIDYKDKQFVVQFDVGAVSYEWEDAD
ncbi:MAG: ATP-dependent RecD-like DNA helicase, partial [Lentisphaeria bacterium]|nr:ATP-dependent RecD-like DNA helicase [Lentisphaeria bacterium]